MYSIIKFKSKPEARKYQVLFRKQYGYKPSLFIQMKGKKEAGYQIVKPQGLQRINVLKVNRRIDIP